MTKNYYPFGMQHKGYNGNLIGAENNYKTYQGQELTKDLGLNVHEWKYRISDPAIGRFWQVDPLAGKYPYNSVYAFQENKLGIGVELEGLEVATWDVIDDGISQTISELENAAQAVGDFFMSLDAEFDNVEDGVNAHGSGSETRGAEGTTGLSIDVMDVAILPGGGTAVELGRDYMLAWKKITGEEGETSTETKNTKKTSTTSKDNSQKTVKVGVTEITRAYMNQDGTGYIFQTSTDTIKVAPSDSAKVKEKYAKRMDSIMDRYANK